MINKNLKKRIVTSFALIGLLYLFTITDLILVYCLIVLGVVAIIEFLNLTKKIVNNKVFLYFFNLSFISYIFIFSSIVTILSKFPQAKFLMILLILTCAASDIGGYIFGKILKGPKLTKISPNKTISGSIGSIFLASITLTSLVFFLTDNFNSLIIMISVITSIFCQLGDLFISYLKRKAKVKDTGNFFPGHGGVLDRIDGILIGLPAGLISLIILFQ